VTCGSCCSPLGLAAGWIAVASPVAHLDHHMLTAHMVQHLLLMVVAASADSARSALWLHMRWNLHRRSAGLAGSLTLVLWHVPGVFELPLQVRYWHTIEHASFFIAGLLFWYPRDPSYFHVSTLDASCIFSRDVTMRCAFGIPGVLWPRRVPALFVSPRRNVRPVPLETRPWRARSCGSR